MPSPRNVKMQCNMSIVHYSTGVDSLSRNGKTRNAHLVADFACDVPLLVAPPLYALPVRELHTTNVG